MTTEMSFTDIATVTPIRATTNFDLLVQHAVARYDGGTSLYVVRHHSCRLIFYSFEGSPYPHHNLQTCLTAPPASTTLHRTPTSSHTTTSTTSRQPPASTTASITNLQQLTFSTTAGPTSRTTRSAIESASDDDNRTTEELVDEINDGLWHSDFEGFEELSDGTEEVHKSERSSGDEAILSSRQLPSEALQRPFTFDDLGIAFDSDSDDDKLIVRPLAETEQCDETKKKRRRGTKPFAVMSDDEQERARAKKARKERARADRENVGVHHRRNIRAKERKKYAGPRIIKVPPRILIKLKNATVISSSFNATDLGSAATKGAYQGKHRPVQPDDRVWTLEKLLQDGLIYIEWDGK